MELSYGVLVISHGSRDENWVRYVDEAVAQIELPAPIPIYSSFLELVEGRLIQDGIDDLEARGVTDLIVIPLFISSGSTHLDEISYALGVIDQPLLATDLRPFRLHSRVHLGMPIDDDPIIAELLWTHIRDLSIDPAQELVLIVGHGSIQKGFHLQWRTGLEKLARRIKQLGGFAEVDYAMLLPDQLPWKIKWWQKRNPALSLIIAPLFLSEGYYTKKVIPARLQQVTYRYHGRTLLPHRLIAKWMEHQIIQVLSGSADK